MNEKRLRDAYNLFMEKESFTPGQLVKWKPGMINKKIPGENEVGIVIEMLEEPLRDNDGRDAGSPYFREPLDLVLGVFDQDGDFITFYFDSRRFTSAESKH